MNFFDSQMGRRFFEGQLPQLIKALQGISDKLSRPATAIRLSAEPDPDFLTEMYKQSQVWEPTEESRRLTHTIIDVQQGFLPALSEQERKIFEQYQEVVEERDQEFAKRAYRTGFQTAVQMMVAGLSFQPEDEQKGWGKDD